MLANGAGIASKLKPGVYHFFPGSISLKRVFPDNVGTGPSRSPWDEAFPMTRSLLLSRLLFALLALIHAATLFAIGAIVVAIDIRRVEADHLRSTNLLILIGIVFVVIRSFVLAQMPAIVRNCHWQLLRPLTCYELAGIVGGIVGIASEPGLMIGWPIFLIASALICPLALIASRGGASPLPEQPGRFFLFSRGHIADWSARRHFAASIVLAGLFSALLTLILNRAPAASGAIVSRPLSAVLGGLAAGLAVNLLQMSSVRNLGLIAPGLLILAMATLGHALTPQAVWPAALLGIGTGLQLASLGTCLLLHVLPRHRFAAIFLTDIAAGIAIAFGILLCREPSTQTTAWIVLILAIAAFGLFLKLYFREFAEVVYEICFWPLYRFDVRGPGRWSVPTRGPTLTIANHAAYFDPLFLCKVLPLGRIRAMMISTFLDRPFLKWLAGDVYEAIRVPENPGFRRHAPELDEAIAALKNGQNVMIFPEAWLRRKEEQPIRRFAQGVYRILSEVPDAVVIPCWIETSWGSYLSFKGGPPTKNKKFDIWFRIQYAIGEPVVLPREMLEDQIATRRHLMELVVNARSYLGLPPHPIPAFGARDDDKADQHPYDGEPESTPN
jgi:1-acyl-sn-glycerol-3-phosphate acyltransferase